MANPRTQFSEKSQLREAMRDRLRKLSQSDRQMRSVRICESLSRLLPGKKDVALFSPTETEPDVDLLWGLNVLGDLCVSYPRCEGDTLIFRPVSSVADLAPGRYGICEPGPGPKTERLDLIVVPGVAFAADGARLGRGGGFYDRFLATIPPTTMTVGVCFEFQRLAEIRHEPHDRKVDRVITG
ncbi:MAG TPA: 5-formyltetrahydrofolate cyclo-ligase [Chthoniobacterales bacterium]|nr:5-formyltetrahydrofolate cyclo-ligase [Chthoniobacterales bacterium]